MINARQKDVGTAIFKGFYIVTYIYLEKLMQNENIIIKNCLCYEF